MAKDIPVSLVVFLLPVCIYSCLSRKNKAKSFWANKLDSRSGVVHLVKRLDWPGFYGSSCGYLIDKHEYLRKASSEQIVHFLCCKRCLAAMVSEENKQC
jgi:hypothetical protein